jgi:dynein intermediate chain
VRGGADPSEPPAPPEVTVEYINTYTEIYDMPSKVIKPETYSKSVQTTMVSTGTQAEEYDEDASRRDGAGHETENETWSRMVAQLDEERRQLERELKDLKAKTDNLQLQRESDAGAQLG